jgi:hypothetical protein
MTGIGLEVNQLQLKAANIVADGLMPKASNEHHPRKYERSERNGWQLSSPTPQLDRAQTLVGSPFDTPQSFMVQRINHKSTSYYWNQWGSGSMDRTWSGEGKERLIAYQ